MVHTGEDRAKEPEMVSSTRSGPTPFMTLDLLIPYKNMKSVCAAIVPRTLEFIKSITQWLIFKYFDFFEGVGRVAG